MSTTEVNDPMGAVSRRKLRIFFLADASSSMTGEPIARLNRVMADIIPELKEASEDNPQAEFEFRTLRFSTGAEWMDDRPIPVEDYLWTPIEASGTTDLGAAIDALSDGLSLKAMGPYNYPPVIVLLTDGFPTDDWQSALKKFNESPFGKKVGRTVRCAISLMSTDNLEVLEEFVGNPELVLRAENFAQLRTFLRFATIELSQQVSRGASTSTSEDDAPDAAAREAAVRIQDLQVADDDEVW